MRYHATAQGHIPFALEEESEWDAREAQIAADALLPKVPQSVQKWAALAALIDAGMDTLPDTYFQSIPAGKQRKLAQAKWQQKPELSIKSPILLAAIAGGIITQSQVDALMIQAAEIARTELD